jgi:hypothetical protein
MFAKLRGMFGRGGAPRPAARVHAVRRMTGFGDAMDWYAVEASVSGLDGALTAYDLVLEATAGGGLVEVPVAAARYHDGEAWYDATGVGLGGEPRLRLLVGLPWDVDAAWRLKGGGRPLVTVDFTRADLASAGAAGFSNTAPD